MEGRMEPTAPEQRQKRKEEDSGKKDIDREHLHVTYSSETNCNIFTFLSIAINPDSRMKMLREMKEEPV